MSDESYEILFLLLCDTAKVSETFIYVDLICIYLFFPLKGSDHAEVLTV